MSRSETSGVRRLKKEDMLPTMRIFKFLLYLFRQASQSGKKQKKKKMIRKNSITNTVKYSFK